MIINIAVHIDDAEILQLASLVVKALHVPDPPLQMQPQPEQAVRIKRKYTKHKSMITLSTCNDVGLPVASTDVTFLKQNERICRNRACKKVFKREKFDQIFCSIKCEAIHHSMRADIHHKP